MVKQGSKDNQVLKDLLVKLDQMASKGLLDLLALKDHQVPKGQLEILVTLAPLVNLVLQVSKVMWDPQDHLETKEILDQKDLQDSLDQLVPLELLDQVEFQEILVWPVVQANKVLRVQLVNQDF